MANQETLKKFDVWYERTYCSVVKYVISKCRKLEDVEDIMQNIYLEVYKKIHAQKEINSSYIIGIAKHKVKDYYRFHYKEKILSFFSLKEETEIIDTIPSNVDIEKSMEIQYDIELVWEYLNKKKTVISKIFYLYFQMGLTIKEISKTLDLTESNVKHYLYRTLEELQNHFKEGLKK